MHFQHAQNITWRQYDLYLRGAKWSLTQFTKTKEKSYNITWRRVAQQTIKIVSVLISD